MKQLPSQELTQESLFTDIDELPPIALTLVQAGVAYREALKIVKQGWNAVEIEVPPENYRDFAAYVDEKIGLAQQATGVKNIGGFIVRAIRENYQDPVLQERLQERKEKERQGLLNSLESEMLEKKNALLRQAVRANPALLKQAVNKIQSRMIRERLANYASIQDAYRDGGMVTAEINAILADEFCEDLLAPVYEVYAAERARVVGG